MADRRVFLRSRASTAKVAGLLMSVKLKPFEKEEKKMEAAPGGVHACMGCRKSQTKATCLSSPAAPKR